jgi:hypothetical protein
LFTAGAGRLYQGMKRQRPRRVVVVPAELLGNVRGGETTTKPTENQIYLTIKITDISVSSTSR